MLERANTGTYEYSMKIRENAKSVLGLLKHMKSPFK